MSKIKVGDKYGKLAIKSIEKSLRSSGSVKVVATCACDCGEISLVEIYNLTSGNSTQCKFCALSSRAEKRRTHGHSISRKDLDPDGYNCYTRWQSMKRRCYKEYDKRYHDYGGRGIKVCERWFNSYENFLSDMGLPPTRKHQIDRIDNEGDYEPDNCRWVSLRQNARNKRNSKLITAFGETLTQAEWAERTGIKRETIARRLKLGWDNEKALTAK